MPRGTSRLGAARAPEIREPPDDFTESQIEVWEAAQTLELSDPLRVRKLAELFLKSVEHTTDRPTVHYYRRDFWMWDVAGIWSQHDPEWMELTILEWLSSEAGVSSAPKLAEDVCRNVAALTKIPSYLKMPCWWPAVGPAKDHFWLPMRSRMVAPDLLIEDVPEDVSVLPKSSRWFMRGSIPYDYDPFAGCPLWLQWLEDRMQGDKQRIALLQEFFGYWLTPDVGNQAALFLLGESATGKSVVTAVAKALLGSHNVEQMPLANFGMQFALSELDGRLLNICDETGELLKTTEHILKWYIGGKPILVDRKYKGHMQLTPTARLVVCVNTFPKFHDTTSGIWRRLHVIPMNAVVSAGDRTPHLERMFFPELPGIFNWALAGLRRMRINGHFSVCDAGESEKQMEQDSSLTHKLFISERITEDPEGFTPNVGLMSAYESWCETNGYIPRATLAVLQHEIERKYPKTHRTRSCVGSVQCRGLSGIRLTG